MKHFFTFIIFIIIFTSGLNLVSAENVEFPDANLANIVREALDLPAGADIPKAQLATLTSLSAAGEGISNLTGLEHALQLTELYLDFNRISDISPLTGLTNLTKLSLFLNRISDISPLARLTQLTVLVLDDNQIRDISPLAGLTALTELNLGRNAISDFSPLAGLTQLTRLVLDDNQIRDISPLAGLTALTELNLGRNAISDLSPLAGLTQLTTLDLTRNEITDISPLAGLTQLMELKIGHENNQINDISPLTGLTRLTRLELTANTISDITPLAGLTELTELRLGGNAISDITPLAGLTELTYLSLDNNKISDVTPLTGLTNLQELWLSGNPIIDRIIGGTPLDETPLWDLLQKNPDINTDIPIDETQHQTLFNKDLEINAGIPLYDIVSSPGGFPAFSPDGTVLAYVTFDESDGSTVKLWNVGTKQNIATLDGHTGFVLSVSFSPDGKLLASTDIVFDENEDLVSSTIKLWDVGARQNIATFEVGARDPTSFYAYDDWFFLSLFFGNPSISFSPDGSLLTFTSIDGIVELWDVATKENIPFFEKAPWITNLSFSPDSTLLAYGASDGTKLWNVETQQNIATLSEDRSFVSFSPDGTLLAYDGDPDGTKLWNVETQQNIATLSEDRSFVSFSPDGTLLAYTTSDDVKLWNMETKKTIATLTLFEGYTEDLVTLSFSPDGTLLMLARAYEVTLWDVKSGELIALLEGASDLSFASATFSPDGTLLATMGLLDDTLILWDITSYLMSPEPEKLAADVNNDGVVNIQDLVLVAASLGTTGQSPADVNADGVVDIRDLVKVAGGLNAAAAAPSLHPQALTMFTAADVQQWLSQTQHLNLTDAISQRGIGFLEQLLAALIPKETTLLPNYPNPFNPETWIPYQLVKDADVTLHIYAVNGRLVRMLTLGHQPAGMYQTRSRAAYWDGKNAVGEPVASGVYFYTLTAGDFTATRKMLIKK
jgi:Leucine-rich repeat (LRR) protein/WD40 repeat protein